MLSESRARSPEYGFVRSGSDSGPTFAVFDHTVTHELDKVERQRVLLQVRVAELRRTIRHSQDRAFRTK